MNRESVKRGTAAWKFFEVSVSVSLESNRRSRRSGKSFSFGEILGCPLP
jgi:hypothetical protein